MSIIGLRPQRPAAYAALLTLALYGLIRSGEALAGDQLFTDDPAPKPDLAGAHEPAESSSMHSPSLHLPLSLSLDRHDDLQSFSATEFRPRPRATSQVDESASPGIIGEKATFEDSVWQRMAEYKSQDRLRLLTLWQTRGSSLSLQTGKHGGPSLQWSSPWMMRGGASSGLLDRWLSVPLHGLSNPSRNTAVHPAPEPAKQANPTNSTSAP